MNKKHLLESAKELESFLDEVWGNPKLQQTNMMPLFKIHRLLIQLHKEQVYELEPREQTKRRNAIDLGEQKNVISR